MCVVGAGAGAGVEVGASTDTGAGAAGAGTGALGGMHQDLASGDTGAVDGVGPGADADANIDGIAAQPGRRAIARGDLGADVFVVGSSSGIINFEGSFLDEVVDPEAWYGTREVETGAAAIWGCLASKRM